LALHPDPHLEARLDREIEAIAAAQESDGYLFTPRTAPSEIPPIGIGETRWSNLAVSHELYNAGHLYEAAVAHFHATGKRSLLDIAIRNANLVADTFGPDKLRAAPGHQVIEMGLVKLYRVTGDERYLNLARYFLDQRGRDLELRQYPAGHRFAIYNDPVQIQAHAPVVEQRDAVGHAVRAMYLYSGMADVAAITGDPAYLGAMEALWEDVVARKMYLTGGVGSRHGTEGFGERYELPNDTGYAETCASIGLVFWSWRLFLWHGEAHYLDVLERVLYNGLLAGVSIEGDRFFYPNPLESDGKSEFNQGAATRKPWFGTACCPGNVARFLPALPGYVYAQRDDALYVANFIPSETTVRVHDTPVTVNQATNYPWDGRVRISVDPVRDVTMSLRVRIPGWSQDRPVPSELYRYEENLEHEPSLRINEEVAALELAFGFAVIERSWTRGDVVELDLPMPVHRVLSHADVTANRGRVALERGPLVYCVEGADNGGRALDVVLRRDGQPSVEPSDWIGEILTIRAAADAVPGDDHLTAIPYFAWSHRGPNEMAVWLHATP
ncbi:MAG TPA: beta-L-arabinofuranosidase domain-containing protein, partial [Vicinamibacteria bacterium]|nr:beta-L-arabinofuranosidase domain-containing protein [Vicinamibacteria bacterium]